MSFELQEEITDYIERTYPNQFQELLKAALSLFDAFEHTAIYDRLRDLLYDPESDDPDVLSSGFVSTFEQSVNELLEAHQLKCFEEVQFGMRVQILAAALMVTNVEDPTPYIRILETDLSNEEQFAKILEGFLPIDEATVLSAVEEVHDEFIARLHLHLSQREAQLEAQQEEAEVPEELFGMLKTYFQVVGGQNLASEMLKNGMKPGWSINTYLPYVEDYLKDLNTAELARDFLGLFFMSSDTYKEPLQAYRKHSELVLSQVDQIQAVETAMMEHLNGIAQLTGANNVARSLSSTLNPT